jgi:hypothetical protein
MFGSLADKLRSALKPGDKYPASASEIGTSTRISDTARAVERCCLERAIDR